MTHPTPNVARLRELAEKATPGPWNYGGRWTMCGVKQANSFHFALRDRDDNEPEPLQGVRDFDYLCHVDPSTILALLKRVEAAERVVERVRIADHNADDLRSMSEEDADAISRLLKAFVATLTAHRGVGESA